MSDTLDVVTPEYWDEARKYLDTLKPGDELTSTELVEKMYAEALARGDMILRRQKMFNALRAAFVKHLMRGYVHAGPAKMFRGKANGKFFSKPTNPPRWHKFDPAVEALTPLAESDIKCPCCGSIFKLEDAS